MIIVLISLIAVIIVCVLEMLFTIRRLHDLDQSGWLSLIEIIPCVGLIMSVVLMILPGTVGPNKYGNGPEPVI